MNLNSKQALQFSFSPFVQQNSLPIAFCFVCGREERAIDFSSPVLKLSAAVAFADDVADYRHFLIYNFFPHPFCFPLVRREKLLEEEE